MTRMTRRLELIGAYSTSHYSVQYMHKISPLNISPQIIILPTREKSPVSPQHNLTLTHGAPLRCAAMQCTAPPARWDLHLDPDPARC